jgi:hypothetical protein
MRATPRVDTAVQQLKGIFLERPTTEMTVDNACRLTGLEAPVCDVILRALADVHFLRRRHDGVFVFVYGGEHAERRSAERWS